MYNGMATVGSYYIYHVVILGGFYLDYQSWQFDIVSCSNVFNSIQFDPVSYQLVNLLGPVQYTVHFAAQVLEVPYIVLSCKK